MEKTSPLVFDRYELKYLIPASMVGPISKHIEAYCELDPYSLSSADQFYTVNSLYLDSPSFLFLRKKFDEAPERFNMRIRGYGGAEFFLELKFKSQGFVKKRRAFCRGDVAETLSHYTSEENGIACGNKHLFMNALYTYRAEPKVLTQYRRKAYFSKYDDYARITFDKDLRYHEESEFNIFPDPARISHYDDETIFDDDTSVILELKCPQQVPLWFIDIITKFDLTRSGFSKYSSSVQHLFSQTSFRQYDRILNQRALV